MIRYVKQSAARLVQRSHLPPAAGGEIQVRVDQKAWFRIVDQVTPYQDFFKFSFNFKVWQHVQRQGR